MKKIIRLYLSISFVIVISSIALLLFLIWHPIPIYITFLAFNIFSLIIVSNLSVFLSRIYLTRIKINKVQKLICLTFALFNAGLLISYSAVVFFIFLAF